MKSNKKTARIVGVLFIIASAAPISTFYFLGSLFASDYLVAISANETQVLGGMLIELIWALAVVGIAVMLFPILKKHNEALARWFYSIRFIEAICVIIGSIALLPLLSLSREFVTVGAPVASYYQTLGTLLLAARDATVVLGVDLIFPLSALILNYILYQSRLIPRWLSGWGFVGGALWLTGGLLGMFGLMDKTFLAAPIAVQEMAFAIWLIVKGFNPAAIAPASTKADN